MLAQDLNGNLSKKLLRNIFDRCSSPDNEKSMPLQQLLPKADPCWPSLHPAKQQAV